MSIPRVEDYLPTPVLAFAAVVVLAMLIFLMLFGRSWGRSGGFALLVVALAWVPLNKPIEGPILMRLGHDKGLVLADVLAIVAVLIACWRIAVASTSQSEREREMSVSKTT